MKALHKEKVGDYKIKVFLDDCPDNPRDWDNIGVMICFHRRYNLGDKHNYKQNNFSNWEELKNTILKNEKDAVILPIYMYSHSGITIKTTPFNDSWDSGQVGWIFVSREKWIKEFGIERSLDPVEQVLINEVKIYDKYLSGECYRFNVTLKKEFVDACGGFYELEDCIQEAKRCVI